MSDKWREIGSEEMNEVKHLAGRFAAAVLPILENEDAN